VSRVQLLLHRRFRLVEPRHENWSVRCAERSSYAVPVRPANAELRQREYLTPKEVEKLIKTAKDGRYGHRDATLILIAFRHGLRAQKSAISNGRRSSSADQHPCMFAGQRTESPAFTRSAATKSGHCGSFSASFQTQNTSFPLSAVVHAGCC
jgi:hypothetical protein